MLLVIKLSKAGLQTLSHTLAGRPVSCSKTDGDGYANASVSMVATLSKKRSREAAGIGHDEEEALLVANGVPPESSLFQLQVICDLMITLFGKLQSRRLSIL